jgi:tetratricopeptide (TPR) repeat protein
MKRTALLSFLFAAVCSNAALADYQQAARANAEGNREYFAARYTTALGKFEQALLKATEADDKQYQAIAMYGIARTNGQMCKLADAEKWFRESISLRETLPDDKYARVTQNYLEFARFLLTYGRDKEAIPYIEKAIPNLEKLGIEVSDPIAFADLLVDYARSLRKLDQTSDAELVQSRATELRAKFPNRSAQFKPEKYPEKC